MLSRCSALPSRALLAKVMVFSFGLCFSGAVLGQNALQDYQMMPVAFPQTVPSSDPDGSPQPLPSLANMLERVNPAVVNIATRSVVRERNRLLEDPFIRRFFNVPKSRQRYRRTQSAGSGVVVDASAGYIVTNAHVVKNADEISIGVSDGRTLEATLIGMDPEVDLALLQVPAEDLTEIDYADSARLRVGDFVVGDAVVAAAVVGALVGDEVQLLASLSASKVGIFSKFPSVTSTLPSIFCREQKAFSREANFNLSFS